jgi:hypothetical protein
MIKVNGPWKKALSDASSIYPLILIGNVPETALFWDATKLSPTSSFPMEYIINGFDAPSGHVFAPITLSTNNVVLHNGLFRSLGYTSFSSEAESNNDGDTPMIHFEPILQNVSGIKESADPFEKKQKISSASITLSHLFTDNTKFGDILKHRPLVGEEIHISWANQSTDYFNVIHSYEMGDSVVYGDKTFYPSPFSEQVDALPIFRGIITKVTISRNKVTIRAEDQIDAKVNLKLPNQFVAETSITPDGFEAKAPEEYVNAPIPIVFGRVDYSPCVIDQQYDVNTYNTYAYKRSGY